MKKKLPTYRDAVRFHGHSCPGLALGYRVAVAALETLGGGRSKDEEFVAIVENNSCAVDAIQLVCGCTAGKGNYVFKDYGKHAYTFFNRKSGQGIRIYAEPFYMDDEEDERFKSLIRKNDLSTSESRELENIKNARVKRILAADRKDFMKLSRPLESMPERALILDSRRCDFCGERVMETRIEIHEGRAYCRSCRLRGFF
jgi:formylmethanofuran dehydrogenase subunit E